MDLASLDLSKFSENCATLHVQHPITTENMVDENGQDVTITLLGMESSIAQRITKARAQKHLNARKSKQDLDEMRQFTISLLSKLVTASHGFTEDGVPIDLADEATAIRIFTKYSWLREQVDEFLMDRANFYKA